MAEAIKQLVPFAVAVALSPAAIVAMVVTLTTPHSRERGVAFAVGWFLGIGLAGAILLAIARPWHTSSQDAPTDWVNWLQLLLGASLLLAAMNAWRGRPGAEAEASIPGWRRAIDGSTTTEAGGLAILLGPINPENLLFIAGGVAAAAATGISSGDQAIAWVVFTLVATIGVAVPLVVYLAMGDHASAILDRLAVWMTRNGTTITAVLCLIIGLKLISDSAAGFSN